MAIENLHVWKENKDETGGGWHCTNCHAQVYMISEAAQLEQCPVIRPHKYKARIAELEAEMADVRSARAGLVNARDELRKQLADLRADRDTLADEVRAWRANAQNKRFTTVKVKVERITALKAAADFVDASGALTRAGKDHP